MHGEQRSVKSTILINQNIVAPCWLVPIHSFTNLEAQFPVVKILFMALAHFVATGEFSSAVATRDFYLKKNYHNRQVKCTTSVSNSGILIEV